MPDSSPKRVSLSWKITKKTMMSPFSPPGIVNKNAWQTDSAQRFHLKRLVNKSIDNFTITIPNLSFLKDKTCLLFAGVTQANKLIEAKNWTSGVADCSEILAYTRQGDHICYRITLLIQLNTICIYEVNCTGDIFRYGRVGDGICDAGTNVEQCLFDGNDCCDPDLISANPNTCEEDKDGYNECRCKSCQEGKPCIEESSPGIKKVLCSGKFKPIPFRSHLSIRG